MGDIPDIEFQEPEKGFYDRILDHIDDEPNKDDKPRTKTSLRMKYEAEVKVIKDQIGDLEVIRQSLNLSRREICQILMVDPSAWTRWNKEGEDAPPHIYRALQWYTVLLEKSPEWNPSNSFSNVINNMNHQKLSQITSEMENRFAAISNDKVTMARKVEDVMELWQKDKRKVLSRLTEKEQIGLTWKFLLLGNTLLMAYFLIKLFIS